MITISLPAELRPALSWECPDCGERDTEPVLAGDEEVRNLREVTVQLPDRNTATKRYLPTIAYRCNDCDCLFEAIYAPVCMHTVEPGDRSQVLAEERVEREIDEHLYNREK